MTSPSPLPTSTKIWVVENLPVDSIREDTFKLVERPIEALKDGEILVKVVAFSNDPALRGWIQKDYPADRLYRTPVKQGQDMEAAGAIVEVLASRSSKWQVGQRLMSMVGWREYAVLHEDTEGLREAFSIPGQSQMISLSSLGGTALTAWIGLHEVAHVNNNDVVVISGAAGAVGSMAVQIAKKLVGAKKVIGIAGGSKKCEWAKSLGADYCIDYKSPSFEEDLAKVCNKEVSVFYDNVGGNQLDLMLAQMRKQGRIVACGSISIYNGGDTLLKNYYQLIAMGVSLSGFLFFWYPEAIPKALKELKDGIESGKIVTEGMETIVSATFEEVPKVWESLFSGGNTGKLITALQL